MLLTGKAKEDFEKWFRTKRATAKFRFWMLIETDPCVLNSVIIEWFDSVGIYIEPLKEYSFGFIIHIGNYKDPISSLLGFDSRQEAITEAIKKSNELYNLKNK